MKIQTRFIDFVTEATQTYDEVSANVGVAICKELCSRLGVELVPNVGEYTEGEPNKAYIGGAIRRGDRMIKNVDVLVTKEVKVDDLEDFAEAVIEKKGTKQISFVYRGLQFMLWFITDMTIFGSMMMHITGPKGYNIGLRMVGNKNGYKINQYGVFTVNDDGIEELIDGSGDTEGGFYSAIKYDKYPHGKHWKAPEERGN